jgi:hypothetical protein
MNEWKFGNDLDGSGCGRIDIFTYGGGGKGVVIGTRIYSLWLQARRITIVCSSFFKSFHQLCTGRSLETSSETN